MRKIIFFLFVSALSYSQQIETISEPIKIEHYKFIEMYLNQFALKNVVIPETSNNTYLLQSNNKTLIKSYFTLQSGFNVYIDIKENRLSVKKYVDNNLVYSTDSYLVDSKIYTIEIVNSSKKTVSLLKDSYIEFSDKIKK